ncbi:hypothetical protein EVG20_g8874 [Dentipellis fragilis]|uniref:rRNA-processing protein EFG1 n=1 Tax=Dentipellis fragilis TaxID=205917 RepID=A0A4Y9Y713_9AGAM|nr:hypothetical protein EVG20_g8874 [Dentipellis fragilis]
MPPTRTRDTKKAGEPSTLTTRDARHKPKKQFQAKETAAPGVSKLKSVLRQARRLLAKDALAANVRVETERRVKALEADLAKAEAAGKERTLAVRYHKIKFFDRQKLVRKIKQTRKQLEASDLTSKARKSLEAALFKLRVDLNYVTNYPKTEKYISLFPPEVRHGSGAEPVHAAPSAEKSATDAKREELRDWIRKRMQAGELSAEPETLERAHVEIGTGVDVWKQKDAKAVNGKGKAKSSAGEKRGDAVGMQDDEFFEENEAEAEEEERDVVMDAEETEQPPAKPTKKRPKKEKDAARKKSKTETKGKAPVAVKDDFFAGGESDGSDESA